MYLFNPLKTHLTDEETDEELPCSLDGKQSACNAGVPGSIPGSVRSPGEGNSYPL